MESNRDVLKNIDLGTKASIIRGVPIPRSWDNESCSIPGIDVCAHRLVFQVFGFDPRFSLKIRVASGAEDKHLVSLGDRTRYCIDSKEFSRRYGVPQAAIQTGNLKHLFGFLGEQNLPETVDALTSLLTRHPDPEVRREGLTHPIQPPPPFNLKLTGKDLHSLTQHIVSQLKNNPEPHLAGHWKKQPFLACYNAPRQLALTLWSGAPEESTQNPFQLGVGRSSVVQLGYSLKRWTRTALKIIHTQTSLFHAPIHTGSCLERIMMQQEATLLHHEDKHTLYEGEKLLKYLHSPTPIDGIILPASTLFETPHFSCTEMDYYPVDFLKFTGLEPTDTTHPKELLAATCTRGQILNLCRRLAHALAKTHAKKVILFDVKHANIIAKLDRERQPYAVITDLNEAVHEDGITLDGTNLTLEKDPTGHTITLAYCCDEDLSFLCDTQN